MELGFNVAAPASPRGLVSKDLQITSSITQTPESIPEQRARSRSRSAPPTPRSQPATPRTQPETISLVESGEENTTSLSCVSRTQESPNNEMGDTGWAQNLTVEQGPNIIQHWSPISRCVDLSVVVLGGLNSVPVSERTDECARRRRRLRRAHEFVDKVLDESEEAIKLKPSKSDKLTAQDYHSCFRHLHWCLGRCVQMQELAQVLENYDSGRFSGPDAASDYADMAIEICLRHDRALRLLAELRSNGDADEQQDLMASVESVTQPVNDAFTKWLNSVIVGCSSRKCLTSTSCTGTRTKAEASPEPVPDAVVVGMGLLSLFSWMTHPICKPQEA